MAGRREGGNRSAGTAGEHKQLELSAVNQMEQSQKGIPQENRGNGHKSQFGRLSLGVRRRVFPKREHRKRPQGGEESPSWESLGLSSAKPLLP